MSKTPLQKLFEESERAMARERSASKMEPIRLPPECDPAYRPENQSMLKRRIDLRNEEHNEKRADYRHIKLAWEHFASDSTGRRIVFDGSVELTPPDTLLDPAFDDIERTLRIAQCLNCLPRYLRRLVEFKVSNPDSTCTDAAVWCNTSEGVIRKWWMSIRRFVAEFELLHAADENKPEQTPVSVPME